MVGSDIVQGAFDVGLEVAGWLARQAAGGFGEAVKEHTKACAGAFVRRFQERFGKRKVIIPPRALVEAVEAVSWVTDETVREMWVGLLGSGSSQSGPEDVMVGYVRMLDQLTAPECRLLTAACQLSRKMECGADFVRPAEVHLDQRCALIVAGVRKVDRLNAHLGRLSMLQLGEFHGSLGTGHTGTVYLQPSVWALGFYLRCMGVKRRPAQVFRGGVVPLGGRTIAEASAAQAVYAQARRTRRGQVELQRLPTSGGEGTYPWEVLGAVPSVARRRRKKK